MSISPWAVGQVSPAWTIVCMRDNGTAMNLTGVTVGQLSLVIYSASYVEIGTGAGSFTILSTNPGCVRYTLDPTDASTSGTFYLRVVVDFNGTSPDMSDYMQWLIEP